MSDIDYTVPGSVTIQLDKTTGRRDVLEVHFQRAGSGERQRAVKPLVDELAEMNVPVKLRNVITQELVEKVLLHLHFVPFRIMFCVADPCRRQLQQRHTGPRVPEGDEREAPGYTPGGDQHAEVYEGVAVEDRRQTAGPDAARRRQDTLGTCRVHVHAHMYMIFGVQLEQDKLDLQEKLKVRVVFMSRCMNTCSYDLCAGRRKRERAAA